MPKSLISPKPCSPRGRLLLLAVFAILATACGVKPEQRIKDPNCQYCYELPSGVTYKTFQYYDP